MPDTAHLMDSHACHFIANDGLDCSDRRELAAIICIWQCGGRDHRFDFAAHDSGNIRRRGDRVRPAWSRSG